MVRNALVSGTDDLTHVYQLLDAVRAPAGNTGDGENRGEQLRREIQHTVNKPAVKVYVGAYAFVDAALFPDDLGGQPRHIGIQGELLFAAFGFGKHFHERFKDIGAGIG